MPDVSVSGHCLLLGCQRISRVKKGADLRKKKTSKIKDSKAGISKNVAKTG